MIKSVLIVSLISFAAPAFAKTIYYPQKYCAEIVSAEYSTGSGDTAYSQYEILCKSTDGKYTTFQAEWATAAGMFGLGRVFSETRIDLVPYDGEELKSE